MAARSNSTSSSRRSPICRRRADEGATPGPPRLLLPAVAAGLALCATAAAASVIVVRSIGPVARAYPVGRTLPDSVRIRLRRGESVTVLGRGATRIFRGPGIFSPSNPVRPGPRGEARRPRGARLGGIMMSSIDRRAPFSGGAILGILLTRPFALELPTIWDIDPAWSGTICLRAGSAVRLVRPDQAGGAPLEVAAAGEAPRTLAWDDAARFLAWPADLPIAEGAVFELRSGTAAPHRITVRLLPQLSPDAAGGDPVALADALLAHGCRAQLDRLVEATLIDETE